MHNARSLAPQDSLENSAVTPRSVGFFILFLSVVTAAIAAITAGLAEFGKSGDYWALLPLALLVVVAESMDVRYRIHGQVEGVNLLEAVLAPLVFAFAGPLAMLVVIVGQVAAGTYRRNDAIKTIFNAAQWALATGVASLIFLAFATDGGATARNLVVLLIAMVAMGAINRGCLTMIFRLAQQRPLREVIGSLSAMVIKGSVAAWAFNTLVGLLFVLAYDTSPWAVVLFFVPLFILRAAYRGYAGTESDRTRLAGLHRASQLLAAPVEPDHAVADFLTEVASCFEAFAAELLIVEDEQIVVHSVVGGKATSYRKWYDDHGAAGLRGLILKRCTTTRVAANDGSALGRAVKSESWNDCLATPLPTEAPFTGALVVYNQSGLDGFEEGERAVLEALARETASSFEKGRLFATIKQERHKLSQLVETTYDGILSLDAFGIVRAWNAGWATITGLPAEQAVGKPLRSSLKVFTLDGREVPLARWIRLRDLPPEVRIATRDGGVRWMQCSYTKEVDTDGETALIRIVAHDVTDSRRVEELTEDVGRLAELEALQRQRVLQLQESLQPNFPVANQAEFGVHYLPSDTNAPTGGDFYDWKVLPDGDIHIAVVDVLGHGVEATNDAFAVIHTLRTLAFQGTPVEELVASADTILGAASPELVATVIALRYNPVTGTALLAGGGHPPALVVHAGGSVREVAAPGIPIGWPGAGSEGSISVQLDPLETLVLYTDGLIESRRDILLGLEELARIASEVHTLAANDMAKELVERSLIGAERRDDSLALVLRHAGSELHGLAPLQHRGPPTVEQVPTIRHLFRAWATDHVLDVEVVDDLSIVVSELVTNSVRAADRFVEVRAGFVRGGLYIEVEDDGPGFDYRTQAAEPTFDDDEHGRGLAIVRMLVDEVDVACQESGCTVRLFKATECSQVTARRPITAPV